MTRRGRSAEQVARGGHDVVLAHEDLLGCRAQRDERVVAGETGDASVEAGVDEFGDQTLADTARAARLVDDEDTSGDRSCGED